MFCLTFNSNVLARWWTGGCWIILLGILLTCGCQRQPPAAQFDETVAERAPLPVLPPIPAYTNILESSYMAADALAQIIYERDFMLEYPIVAASFVNINKLTESSTLGRLLPEYIGSRLAQYGFNIIEIKLRQDSVFIKKDSGEFMLTRDLRHLNPTRDIHSVLVGTYAVADQFVFVSARLVKVQDNAVIAGYNFEIPIDPVVRALLQ